MTVAGRVRHILEEELDRLEAVHGAAGPHGKRNRQAPDRERNIRLLEVLTRILHRLELVDRLAGEDKEEDDTEAVKADLERRLSALFAEAGSGQADSGPDAP